MIHTNTWEQHSYQWTNFFFSSRIYWHIWLQLFPGMKQMVLRMEREARTDSCIWKSSCLHSTFKSGLHSEKYCQWLISKASKTNNLLNIKFELHDFYCNFYYFCEKPYLLNLWEGSTYLSHFKYVNNTWDAVMEEFRIFQDSKYARFMHM